MTPYKILIVDDEPANLRLLERLFRREYQVLTATSGAEALCLLEQHDVALIISDQRMPGMTGIELLQRAAGFRPHTVRILLTGYTDLDALVEAINCGQVYKYMAKPWKNEELVVAVARAVEHYEANKKRHELALSYERLAARLAEIAELATLHKTEQAGGVHAGVGSTLRTEEGRIVVSLDEERAESAPSLAAPALAD